jgi:hypothetical protein
VTGSSCFSLCGFLSVLQASICAERTQRHFAKQSQFAMARFRNNPETSCWAIAHLHSAELVDWAQRTVPIKNTLTPTDCSARHLSLGGLRPRASAEA